VAAGVPDLGLDLGTRATTRVISRPQAREVLASKAARSERCPPIVKPKHMATCSPLMPDRIVLARAKLVAMQHSIDTAPSYRPRAAAPPARCRAVAVSAASVRSHSQEQFPLGVVSSFIAPNYTNVSNKLPHPIFTVNLSGHAMLRWRQGELGRGFRIRQQHLHTRGHPARTSRWRRRAEVRSETRRAAATCTGAARRRSPGRRRRKG
jgi:hypothetical protein